FVAYVAQSQCKMAALKIALEARPAAIEGMSPSIDDLRIGEDKLDQTDVKEIAHGLVRKKWTSGFAARTTSLQILFAHRAKCLAVEIIERARIGVHQTAL